MYISIEGVIGVGKTTLANLLQKTFDAELLLEVFEENPFLSKFYEDRARYAFQTQIFFLLSRYHQQNESVPPILKTGQNLISDYTFAKDALFANINLEGDELDMYFKVHEALGEKVRLPDLIIYLVADIDIVMQRIATRDRSYERNMEKAYIESLMQTYDDYFEYHYQGPPVLRIDTTHLNFVTRKGDLEFIEHQAYDAVEEIMKQPELPLDGKSSGDD